MVRTPHAGWIALGLGLVASSTIEVDARPLGKHRSTYVMAAPYAGQAPVAYQAPVTYQAPVMYQAPAAAYAPAAGYAPVASAPAYYAPVTASAPAAAAPVQYAPVASAPASTPTTVLMAPTTTAYAAAPSGYGWSASSSWSGAAGYAPAMVSGVRISEGRRRAIIEDLVRFYEELDRTDGRAGQYEQLQREAQSLYETAVADHADLDDLARATTDSGTSSRDRRNLNQAEVQDLKAIIDYVATSDGPGLRGASPYAATAQPTTYMIVQPQSAPAGYGYGTAGYGGPPAPAFYVVPMPSKHHLFKKW